MAKMDYMEKWNYILGMPFLVNIKSHQVDKHIVDLQIYAHH